MPIDKPEATAAMNTRRTFLARAAMGSAFAVTAGSLLPSLRVGAQPAPVPDGLDDDRYLVMADQLHRAASIVYVNASSNPGLSDEARDAIMALEADHQTVVDAFRALMGSSASKVDTVPDPTVVAVGDSLGGDEGSVLRSLAELEEQLSATHLWAIGSLDDGVTARSAAAAAASSGQRATHLGRLAGADLASLAPATVDDAQAIGPALAAADASLAGEEAEPATTTTIDDEPAGAVDEDTDETGAEADTDE